MAALACDDAARLGTATFNAGGAALGRVLSASNGGLHHACAPPGDLLLAAALSAMGTSSHHFMTTQRARSQRKAGLIKQSGRASSYSQRAAALSQAAELVRSESVLSDDGAVGPVLHNLRDSRRPGSACQQVPALPASGSRWHFDLALQSSML